MTHDMILSMRAAMQAQHVTQAELARRVGTRQPAISAVLSGSRQPTLGLMQRMMDALGLEVRLSLKRQGDRTNG